MPLDRRTRATLRRAEFGFLGVVVYTRVHTPRRCGQESKALDLLLALIISRPFLTNCCIVGILYRLKFRTAKVMAGTEKPKLFSVFLPPYPHFNPKLI